MAWRGRGELVTDQTALLTCQPMGSTYSMIPVCLKLTLGFLLPKKNEKQQLWEFFFVARIAFFWLVSSFPGVTYRGVTSGTVPK